MVIFHSYVSLAEGTPILGNLQVVYIIDGSMVYWESQPATSRFNPAKALKDFSAER